LHLPPHQPLHQLGARTEVSNKDFVNWFRSTSPYINAHRGSTFVLMFPGECVEEERFIHLIQDIALLKSLGIKVVLVHGARRQIDECLQQHGHDSQFHNGLRVTEPQHLTAIHQAIGALRIRIEAALSTGLPNSPMHGAHIDAVSGNFVSAAPCGVIDGIDHHHTGKVRRIDGHAIKKALHLGSVVVAGPLG
jgi:amino-acid N-acetyltransferase